MAQSHDDLEPSVYGIGEIENHSWQNSTIEACTNTFNSMCIIISPSQFRRLLSPKCRSEAVRSARYIVQTIRMYIGSKKIIILIADEIQKFNIAVFQPKNKNHSLNMALAEGRKIADIFSEAFQQLRVDDSQEIKILCWNDIVRSSNYNERVEQIQQYVNNNESECGRLIDKVCESYVQSRRGNSDGHCKRKYVLPLRQYVIHELPALLNGIDYEENSFTFMLHPILSNGNCNGDNQRQAMVNLLNHMRANFLANSTDKAQMCNIFDIAIPCSSSENSSVSITSSRPSTPFADTNSISSRNSHNLPENYSDNSGFLWFILFLQIISLIIYHFLVVFFFQTLVLYSFYLIYKILIRMISKRGQWYSTTNKYGQEVLGTEYQSFFGDLPAIQSSQNGYFLNDLHANLNHPQVYRIWMGPQPALMLAHPQAVREFWSQHDERSVERNVHLGWALEMLMGDGVGFRSVLDRDRITKFFHQCFSSNRVQHFDDCLEKEVTEFFNQYSSNIMQYQDLRYLAHDAGVYLFLGKVGSDHLDELHALVDELGELMSEVFNARWENVPLIGYYLLPKSYNLRQRIHSFKHRVHNVINKIIAVYRESPPINDNENSSIVEHFARSLNPSITFDELTDTIIEGLLAPNDGTAGTFMNTLILLAMHPDIQQELRQQIQNCTDLSLKSLGSVTYLNRVLNECQRLLPIFMFNVPEFSSKSMIVGGIQIPKNTMVMLDVVSLNHNQHAWQANPLTFCPERFHLPVSADIRKAYHGFGNGHLRRCLGQHLVKNLHRLFLAHLLSCKEILLNSDITSISDIRRCRLPFIYVPIESVRLVDK